MDSPLGSEFESDHDRNIASDLEEAQAKATYEKKRCKFEELKSSEGGKEKEAAAKKTSNRQNDGPDSDFASINPKKNAGFQMAPSVGEQKDANRPDNRFGHRHSDANNQGHFNVRGRRQLRGRRR